MKYVARDDGGLNTIPIKSVKCVIDSVFMKLLKDGISLMNLKKQETDLAILPRLSHISL